MPQTQQPQQVARKVDVNTFTQGMVKDLALTVQKADSYKDALNIRLVPNKEGGLGSAVNIKGNDLAITLPDTSAIWLLEADTVVPPIGTTFFLRVYTTGYPGGLTAPAFTTTDGTFEEMITKFLIQIENDPTLAIIGLKAAKTTDNKLIIWATKDTLINTGAIYESPTPFSNHYKTSLLLPMETEFVLLGSTTLRTDTEIYSILMTCGENLIPSNGQVWKLSYDAITDIPTVDLIYNGALNFSKEFPIEVLGKFETVATQRIYWTDRHHNPVRCMNVADPGIMGLDAKLMDLVPEVAFSKPILKEVVSGGTLQSGIYQYAYRLKAPGISTRYSPFSNLIHIVKRDASEDSDYNYREPFTEGDAPSNNSILIPNVEYHGTEGEETRKAITLEVRGIDLKYKQIEIVAYHKVSLTSENTVLTILEDSIPSTGILEFTHTGNENAIPTSIETIKALGIPFDTAKTITTKDERLLAGNIKGNGFLDLEFNCRAYRFKSDTSTYISSIGVNPFNPNITQTDLDAINPFNLHDNDPAFEEYKFQSDGVTLGGEGPNIKYRFCKKRLEGDKYNKSTPGADQPNVPPIVDKTRKTVTNNLGIPNQTYPNTNTWVDYKSPYIDGLYKGYARGEIYRFALVLFDKKGNPGYAEWIGDIRFPECYDKDPGGNNGGIDLFTLGHTYNDDPLLNGEHGLYPLGIEFTVTSIPLQIRELISGYSIVRVKRTEENKTRLGTGLIQRTVQINQTTAPGFPATPYGILAQPLRTKWWDDTSPDNYLRDDIITFDSPDWTFKEGTQEAYAGDTLRIVGLLEGGFTNIAAYHPNLNYYKNYDMNDIQRYPDNPATPPPSEHPISGTPAQTIYNIVTTQKIDTKSLDAIGIPATSDAEAFATTTYDVGIAAGGGFPAKSGKIQGKVSVLNGTTLVDQPLIYFNVDAKDSDGKATGYGVQTALIGLEESINFGILFGATPGNPPTGGGATWDSTGRPDWKVLASYERIIKDQYGGNKASERANSDYISCGNFIPVEDSYLVPHTFEVYGGDTYVTFYDLTKIRPFSPDAYALPTLYGATEETQFPGYFNEGSENCRITGLIFPTESSVNVDLRRRYHLANRADSAGIYGNRVWLDRETVGFGGWPEEFVVDDIYNVEDDTITYLPRPLFVDLIEDHDNRIYASEVKFSGEKEDKWRDFRTNTTIEVEGIYGPINKLVTYADKVYYLQDNAIGSVRINPKAIVQDVDSIALELGKGGILDSFVYLSTEYGTKHQWSVISSPYGLYWFDINGKKILQLTGEGITPISDVKGMSTYFANTFNGELLKNDNPLIDKGITGTYDRRFSEVLYTFRDIIPDGDAGTVKRETIAYNELMNAFTSFYSFTPSIYINDGKRITTPLEADNSALYLHNKGDYGNFYGVVYDSTLQTVTNKLPGATKVFDNLAWQSQVIDDTGPNPINKLDETISSVRFYDDYQNTDFVTITPLGATPNLKRAEREWQLQIPRDIITAIGSDPDIFNPANFDAARLFKQRLRDKYMIIDLKFDNVNNRRLILHFIKTFFRVSVR